MWMRNERTAPAPPFRTYTAKKRNKTLESLNISFLLRRYDERSKDEQSCCCYPCCPCCNSLIFERLLNFYIVFYKQMTTTAFIAVRSWRNPIGKFLSLDDSVLYLKIRQGSL